MALLERAGAFAYTRLLQGDNRLTRLLVRGQRPLRTASFATTLALYPVFCGLSWAGTLARRARGRKPRIVWGPTPILTIAESSELLRRLGYPSTTVVYTTYHIRRSFDVNLQQAMANPALSYWLPNVVFLWSLLRFDVFHHYYDGGLWSGMRNVPRARWLELPLLRLAGKRVIASAYGADVRMRHLNELWQPYNICRECPSPGTFCICGPEGLTQTKYYRDWSNALLALGDTHDFVFGSRPDFKYHPIDVEDVEFVGVQPHDGTVRVAHSPNHRYFKGTRFIEAAVASLRERGYELELDLVEGVPNEEARRRYAAADIVFAQCLAGWMGYTELEAMAAGKPVLGYIRDPGYLENWGDCPLVSATPETLEAELEALVAAPGLREELGRRGRAYVEREWSYEALAAPYDELHEDVWRRNGLGGTLARKWADVRRGEAGYRVGRPLAGARLGEWPVHADPALSVARLESGLYGQPPFDADGIPRVLAGGSYVEHPGVVARYALDLFHLVLADPGSAEHQARFLCAAEWLRDRLELDGSGVGRWFHHFGAPDRELALPWVSCVTQSVGVSILLRAEQLRAGAGFREAGAAAAELLRVPIADGGVLWEQDARASLEEYPEAVPARGLLGRGIGMFGLHELHRISGERWAAELLHRCASTLARDLAEYERPPGVRRELATDRLLTLDEHYGAVQQLRALHAITGDEAFRRWSLRWTRRLYLARTAAFVRLQAPL